VNFEVNASIVGPFLVMPTMTNWKFFKSALFIYALLFFGEFVDTYFLTNDGGFYSFYCFYCLFGECFMSSVELLQPILLWDYCYNTKNNETLL